MLDLKNYTKAQQQVCDITIQSNLTIHDELNLLKQTLITSMKEYDVINIQSPGEIEVDITFVQLSISLKREAEKLGKQVYFRLKISERSMELLHKSGLSAQILTV